MSLKPNFGFVFFAVVAIGFATQFDCHAQGFTTTTPVVVDLDRTEIRLQKKTLTVADVATVTGGSETLRARISRLDVDEFTANNRVLRIPADQIRYRLFCEPRRHQLRECSPGPPGRF